MQNAQFKNRAQTIYAAVRSRFAGFPIDPCTESYFNRFTGELT